MIAQMQAHVLREKFLDFFKSRKHKIVEPDSLVPKDDPTVLFTPAGMNQFKKEFLGYNAGFSRAATCQRCLRTDDLDKVGKTTGHHTFFEMLGNFSFGDYFKQDAIEWAWEFLTGALKIDEERLWVSVYKDDDEAYKIWRESIKVPEAKIVKLGDKENFWPSEAKQKGPNGPCGPCSEIFFDLGSGIGCKKPDCDPSCNCGRFVEVWNLVFTQYNRREGGKLEPLPKKNIDTGMGLERLTAVMQGVPNNFETDLFKPILKEISVGIKSHPDNEKELVYAIADHIRAIVFAIYDGVLPSNDSRGYVIRKLIRKGTLHLRALGFAHPFLNKLVPVLAEVMREFYPNLDERKENIAEIILAEEKNFIVILDSIKEFTENEKTPIIESAKRDKATQPTTTTGMVLASATTSTTIALTVVRLYETNGLPIEETLPEFYKVIEFVGVKRDDETTKRDIAANLNKLKELSKSQSKMKGDVFNVPKITVEDVPKTQFLGYDLFETQAKVLKVIQEADHAEQIGVILDKTVFYAESGGQVHDVGNLTWKGGIFSVIDVRKVDDVFIHWGKNVNCPNVGDTVDAKINIEYRMNVARNHTATHLLQAALRKVLGPHVQQQGSLVAADRFRFDFTHFKGLSKEEISRVEEVSNDFIAGKLAVNYEEMPLKEAKKSGALAFFAEKYAENVRVVSIGDISKELCGGTHLDNISQIGLIKIISEGSVASGIRRIEGVTDGLAEQFIKDEEHRVIEESRKRDRIEELKEQEKKLNLQRFNMLKTSIDDDIRKKEVINGIDLINHIDFDANLVRKAVDLVKEKIREKGVIFSTTGTNVANQVFIAIGITQDLSDRGIDASKMIKEVAPEIGGSGGGRKDFAQAGGTKPENLENAFNKLKEIISQIKL